MVTDVRSEQPEKARSGIIVTFSPIVKVVRLVQSLNTGARYDPISVHFSALNITEVNPEQPEKAWSGIIVTFSPIVKVVRFSQPLNTALYEPDPIFVHFSALNVIEVTPEQLEKA